MTYFRSQRIYLSIIIERFVILNNFIVIKYIVCKFRGFFESTCTEEPISRIVMNTAAVHANIGNMSPRRMYETSIMQVNS